MFRISLLLPSVDQKKLQNFIKNLQEVSYDFDSLELVIVLDEGNEYTGPMLDNICVVYHPVMDPIYRSKLFETAYRASTADWIMIANDDIEIQTKDWDKICDLSNPWRLFYFDDGQFRNTFSCHPLTSRKIWQIIDNNGLVFPNFVNMGCDTTLWDVVPTGMKRYHPEIKIKHDRHMDEIKVKEMTDDYAYYNSQQLASLRQKSMGDIFKDSGLAEYRIIIGLSTGEYIRKAEFMPYFLGIDKPPGTLVTTVHGQSPANARNVIIEQALENNCTHALFLDDDMGYPPDVLIRLLQHDVDVVTALYLMRDYPHFPVAFDMAFDNGYNKFAYLTGNVQGVIPITNCGLGCVLIKTEVFKAMEKPWVRLGELIPDGWCDDVGFFNRVRAAGFKLYCDTDLRVGHMAQHMLWPTKLNGQWFTEYRHLKGNVLVPQIIPDDKTTQEQIAPLQEVP